MYNAQIILEQGASVLRVTSSGSVNLAGTLNLSDGGSAAVAAGFKFNFGNTQILFGAVTDPPTVSASPGSLFYRTDGSASNLYVNTSDGTAGSVWASGCVNRP